MRDMPPPTNERVIRVHCVRQTAGALPADGMDSLHFTHLLTGGM